MLESLCEVCGKKPAEFICIQCRRLICRDCMSPVGFLCKECYEFKKSIEKNRELQLNYIVRMLNIVSQKVSREMCRNCIIVREFLLSLFKMLRSLQDEAWKENFEKVLNASKEVEKKLLPLLIHILAKQGISLVPRNED